MGLPQSGGMEAVVWLPAKQQAWGPQAPPGACFMQIPASESLLFLFSQKGQIPAGFGEATKPACL